MTDLKKFDPIKTFAVELFDFGNGDLYRRWSTEIWEQCLQGMRWETCTLVREGFLESQYKKRWEKR